MNFGEKRRQAWFITLWLPLPIKCFWTSLSVFMMKKYINRKKSKTEAKNPKAMEQKRGEAEIK